MGYRPLPRINEDLDLLRKRLHQTSDLRLKTRLHLLVLVKAEKVHTRQEAAVRLALHRNTVGRWLRQYQAEGLDGLLRLVRRGAPAGQRALPEPALAALKRRLQDPEGFAGYLEVQQWLEEEFGLELSYKTVHKLVRYRLKAKLKRARPRHAKKTKGRRPALQPA